MIKKYLIRDRETESNEQNIESAYCKGENCCVSSQYTPDSCPMASNLSGQILIFIENTSRIMDYLKITDSLKKEVELKLRKSN